MSRQRKNLKDRFNISSRDMGIFLVALLVSFYFWLVHCLEYQYSVIFDMPVIAESTIDGHSGTSAGASVITARCRATGTDLLKLKHMAEKQVVVKFKSSDLHHVEDDVFSISSQELAGYVTEIYGPNAQLESFISNSVKFRFPLENCKKVPVQAVQYVSFYPQYAPVGDIQLRPDSVLVYGDPVRLESIDRIYTSEIDHSNLKSTAHGEVRLEPVGDMRLSVDKVDYTIEVSRYVEIVSETKISVRNVPPGKVLTVFPSVAKVVYRCIFPVGTDPSKTVDLYIDYNEFMSSRNGRCVPRAASLPASVIDYKVEPEVFECIENSLK